MTRNSIKPSISCTRALYPAEVAFRSYSTFQLKGWGEGGGASRSRAFPAEMQVFLTIAPPPSPRAPPSSAPHRRLDHIHPSRG